jgi:hypothetical protein
VTQDVESDLRDIGVGRWRLNASVREEWAVIVREAKFLHGP